MAQKCEADELLGLSESLLPQKVKVFFPPSGFCGVKERSRLFWMLLQMLWRNLPGVRLNALSHWKLKCAELGIQFQQRYFLSCGRLLANNSS